MKKLNNQTGCYKIDIFYNSEYQCSTDWSKTCKQAKKRFHELNPSKEFDSIKCYFHK